MTEELRLMPQRPSIPLRLLGRSGIRVSKLGLGTMTFGTEWGFGADEEAARKIYAAYREAGGNFVDTANNYNQGTSEEIVGRLVASERDAVVLATKFTFPVDVDNPNSSGITERACGRASRAACGVSAPTTSTCSGSMRGTSARRPTRRCAGWTTSYGLGRCSRSG